MSMAVASKTAYTSSGSVAESACNINAATAATCGADAEVPKKFGNVSGSCGISELKNVVLPPSGPTISGLSRISLVGVPSVSNSIGVGPADEKASKSGGLTPNAGVLP